MGYLPVSVKQTPCPEFSRPIGLERLAQAPFSESIRPTAEERKVLAKRLELQALKELNAEFDILVGVGEDLIEVHGRLGASVAQLCVITLEPVETTLEDRFEVVYNLAEPHRKAGQGAGQEDLDPEEAPVETLGPDGLDLGELATQYLSLALDPFPRKPGVSLEDVWDAEGESGASSPFAELGRWRAEQ
jgi:hypothetical protein